MKEAILDRFKEVHRKLMDLDPTVYIDEILDENGKHTGIYEITVRHDLIFDIRLIPESFEGIKVKNVQNLCDMDKKYFPGEYSMPIWEYYSPEKYFKLVNENLDLIRKKLKNSQLSVQEALDAVTGDFEGHVSRMKEMKEKMISEHKVHIHFFNELIKKTHDAFLESDIYKKQQEAKKEWWYSVTATYILKNSPLIVGFNWGAAKAEKYEPQLEYPLKSFDCLYPELGSLKRTMRFFEDYYPMALTGMQTNFCFFRSPKEDNISNRDLELSTPLFLEYLKYAEPSILISFSGKLTGHFIQHNYIKEIETTEIKSGNRTVQPLKARLNFPGMKDIPMVYLPHPNYTLTGQAREEAWRFCFGGGG